MKPGVSIRLTMGSPCALHSCMKRAPLSAASASMAPPRCLRVVGHQAHGRPSIRASAVWMPAPKPVRSGSRLPSSTRPPWRRGCRTRAGGFRHHGAQQALVRGRIQCEAALEEAQVTARRPPPRPRHRPARRSRRWHAARRWADLLGREHAQAAAFDHGRAAHARLLALVAMITSLQPTSAALPAKAAPTRCRSPAPARQRGVGGKGAHMQPGQHGRRHRLAGRRRPRRTAPPAASARQAQDAVGLGVVACALGACQHGGVVGHDHGGRHFSSPKVRR